MKRFLAAALVITLPTIAQAEHITIEFAGKTCSNCILDTINIFLHDPTVISATADMPHNTVTLTTKADIDDRAIAKTLAPKGYKIENVTRDK